MLNFIFDHWVGILLASVAAIIVAGIWYSPIAFGKAWQKEAKIKDKDLRGGSPIKYLVALFMILLTAVVLERFMVIKGEAMIDLRKVDSEELISFKVNGNEPSYIDMPIWYTHNIKNIGLEDLLTVFWINEFYDQDNPDTYLLEV